MAVCHAGSRAASLEHLRILAKGKHVICLQELHGLAEEILAEFLSLLPGWTVWHSPILDTHGLPDGSHAGVAILVCPLLSEYADVQHTILVAGRIHSVDITLDFNFASGGAPDLRTFTVVNVHNLGISGSSMDIVGTFVAGKLERDQADPVRSTSFVSWISISGRMETLPGPEGLLNQIFV